MSLAPRSLVESSHSRLIVTKPFAFGIRSEEAMGGGGHGVPGTPAVHREPFVLISSRVHRERLERRRRGYAVQFVGMLRTLSLSPEDVEKLSVAYEDALRALQLSSRTDPITTVIAQRIIEAAKTGVRDSAELCALAIKDLRVP